MFGVSERRIRLSRSSQPAVVYEPDGVEPTLTRPRQARGARPALAGVSLAYFMVLLDTTVLAVAEPDLIASLHTDVIGVGWATTAYTMALASALVAGGSLAGRFGAGRVFGIGSAGFGIGSLACALAPGLPALLVSRAVLGLLAAAIIPSSMAILTHLYPDSSARTRAISVWASVSGAAMAAGPVLGGWLVELAGWRAVFVVNLPLSVVVLLLCRGRIATPAQARALDLAPHLGLVAVLATLTLAVTEAGRLHWTTSGLAGFAALLLGLVTVRADSRSSSPLVPGTLRRNRPVWTAFAWGAVVNYALLTILFVVPLSSHADALTTGLTLLPMTLLMALNPLATGLLVNRFGALVPIRLGLAASALGLGGVACALAGEQPYLLEVALLGCGLGVSWTLPALTAYALGHAPAGVAGAVGGLFNAARQSGATFGAAVASAVLVARTGGSWNAVPLVAAAVACALGFLASFVRLSRADV
ncbi:MFS transporter [Flindersiella endophytica]